MMYWPEGVFSSAFLPAIDSTSRSWMLFSLARRWYSWRRASLICRAISCALPAGLTTPRYPSGCSPNSPAALAAGRADMASFRFIASTGALSSRASSRPNIRTGVRMISLLEQSAGFAEQRVQLLVDLDVDLVLNLHIQVDVDGVAGGGQLHCRRAGADHRHGYRYDCQTPHGLLLSWTALQVQLLDPFPDDLVHLAAQLQTGQQCGNILFQLYVQIDLTALLECRVAALQMQPEQELALLIIGHIAGQYSVAEVVQRRGQLFQPGVAGRHVAQLGGTVAQHATRFPGLQTPAVDQQFAIHQADREAPVQCAATAQAFGGIDLEQPRQFDALHQGYQTLA